MIHYRNKFGFVTFIPYICNMEYTYRTLTKEDLDKFIKEMNNQPQEEKREWLLFPWDEAQQKAFDEAMKESFRQLLLYGECQVKIDKKQ